MVLGEPVLSDKDEFLVSWSEVVGRRGEEPERLPLGCLKICFLLNRSLIRSKRNAYF